MRKWFHSFQPMCCINHGFIQFYTVRLSLLRKHFTEWKISVMYNTKLLVYFAINIMPCTYTANISYA